MPGHSRSKNGVASLDYVPGIHVFDLHKSFDLHKIFDIHKTWMAGTKPGHDVEWCVHNATHPTA